MSTEATRESILAAAQAVFTANDAVSLATSGGRVSPWVLGAYFAADGNDLVLFLEQSGKSIANVRANPNVAFLVSKNDAQQDFVQGSAVARMLPPAEEEAVFAKLAAKMPWFRNYTPVVPVRLEVTELVVSSFAKGWFPGKRVSFEGR
jgi:nitroimidazol reductase NimA-like FMN-containing flavoprotein (pyridoxamine 5'-phosphate oxidase superfamily)